MVLRKFALAVVLIGMVGCGKPHDKALGSRGVAVMEAADSMELMTLYPFPSEGGSAASQPEIIHGYRILGRAMVTDAAARRRLVDALFGAIDGSNGPTPSCFNPRHALRATRGQP